MKKKLRFLFFSLLFPGCITLKAQEQDSAYIQKTDRENTLEMYPGYYATKFNFESFGKRRTAFKLTANTSAYTGFFFNYKWLSFQYSWGIPGTELAKGIQLKHLSFSFRYNRPQWSFYPFFDAYNGLLLQTGNVHARFDAFRGVQLLRAGVQSCYYTNKTHYSYKAGLFSSERQLRSAGGAIFSITPMWQKIDWKTPVRGLIKDSVTYELLASDPRWASLVAGAGYNYNIVFDKGKWMISPAFIAGLGGLKELNNNHSVQRIYNMQAWINAGYNGAVFYAYVNGNIQTTQTHLIIRKLNTVDEEISLTLGYRFKSLPKKLMGIL